MSAEVVVVDYNCGNIFNLKNSLEVCGAKVSISNDPQQVRKASKVVLPGVGAFGHGVTNLRKSGMFDAVKEFAKGGKPLLGICLGMQMLTSSSKEQGNWEGLGLIPGEVVNITELNHDLKVKVPQIGWNQVFSDTENKKVSAKWENTILDGWKPGSYVYFVHSMVAKVAKENLLGVSQYGGTWFSSIIAKDNVVGMQFHPERSGRAGLEILKKFVEV